jgi:hypothetical protein
MKEKEKLQELQEEKSSLESNLLLAIDASDGEEISRLKQREKTIDSDLFSAQILALRAEIDQVDAQLRLDREGISKAQALTKQTDALVISQVSVLRGEIQKLNNDSLAKLVAVKMAEQQLATTGARLRELREKLSELLQ